MLDTSTPQNDCMYFNIVKFAEYGNPNDSVILWSTTSTRRGEENTLFFPSAPGSVLTHGAEKCKLPSPAAAR